MKFVENLFKGSKNALFKKQIISYFIQNGATTINDISGVIGVSVPTATKFIDELMELGLIQSYGKLETDGGRHPVLYGLGQDSGYFLGIAVEYSRLVYGVINLNGETVLLQSDDEFRLEDSDESLHDMINRVKKFIDNLSIDKDKLLNIDIAIPGRVNTETGFSYSYFCSGERSLGEYLSDQIGFDVFIDNDSRAMAYGEFLKGCIKLEKNVVFYNVTEGLGLGLILNGEIYMGKSGFTGEIGHTYTYNNQIICYCGKKGCLETEVSGRALKRKFIERVEAGESSIICKDLKNLKDVSLKQIIDAALSEDTLCIDLIQDLGIELGKSVANVMNILNPEAVVLGGDISLAAEYLLEPVRGTVRKHSLNLVNKDSKILISKLKNDACVVGACMLARSRMFIF